MKRSSVLIVEDHEDIRQLIAETLKAEGFEVTEAENGEDAIAMIDASTEKPCLVLLDWMMPIMSGEEFLSVVRESGRLDDVPIVVISAAPPRAVPRGARRVLTKPLTPEVIRQLLADFCAGTNASNDR